MLGVALGPLGCQRSTVPPPMSAAHASERTPGEGGIGKAVDEEGMRNPAVVVFPPVSFGGRTGGRKGGGKDKECVKCMTSHRKTPLG
jgi:hypothetical protein